MKREEEMHAAWAAMRFGRADLQTNNGIPIRILSPGALNHNQGPDFLNAEIEMAGTKMNGHVELHLRSKDWYAHGHQHDTNYNPVILHVVLESNAQPILRQDQTIIPEICLGSRLLGKGIVQNPRKIACTGVAKRFLPSDTRVWLESLGRKRMLSKALRYQGQLAQNQYDWSQVIWQAISQNLGGPINSASFLQLASIADWRLIRKYTFSEEALEAILFGAAGLLSGRALDEHQQTLSLHWEYLKRKHKITQQHLIFKRHRMRPAGMPITRLAQLVKLVQAFSPICQLLEPTIMEEFLVKALPLSSYWKGRQAFGGKCNSGNFELGLDTRSRIVTNVLSPLGELYRQMHFGADFGELSFSILQKLAPESNRITRKFESIGLVAANALQSQGLLALHSDYCLESQCMKCKIGKAIFNPIASA